MRDATAARVELGVLAAATLAGYAALWTAQRTLWDDGLVPGAPFTYPRAGVDPVTAGGQALAVVVLGVLVCGLFVWLVARAERFQAAGLGRAAIGVPTVVALALAVLPPTLSIDAWSYLSHGFLAATGANPYLVPSAAVQSSAYGSALLQQGWQPVHPQTPYGPVWTTIERAAVVLSGSDVRLGVVLVKLPVVVAVLGTAALIDRSVAPERRTRAVLLFLANPLVLIELAGDGHDDGLMAGFLVLAIVCAARGRAGPCIVAFALAVLVKPTALPFALPLAVALVALRRSGVRTALSATGGLLVAAGIAVVTMLPWWAGAATFQGLAASGAATPGWSVSGLLASWLDPSGSAGAPLSTAQLATGGLLVVGTAAAAAGARSAPGLLKACGLTSLLVLLLLPLEWPWYGALPSAVLPLSAAAGDAVAVVVVALGSRLVAPLGDAAALGAAAPEVFRTWQALIGQTVPAAVGLVLVATHRARISVPRPRSLRRPGGTRKPPA